MNVLHILSGNSWSGGKERMTHNICRWSKERGYNVHVVLPPDSTTMIEKFSQVATVHLLRWRNYGDLGKMFALRKIIRENNIQIVNVHRDKEAYMLSIMKYLLCDFPLVFFSHSVNKNPLSFMATYFYKKFNKTVCVSLPVFLQKERDLKGKFNDKMIVLGNAIPIERFKEKATDVSLAYPPIVGFAGRITPEKGADVLVKAIALVNNFHHKPVNLKMIGYFEKPSFDRYLQDFINSANLQDKIEVLKFNEDLSEFYMGLDLFVLPSVATEGKGMVLCESMYVGVPVISTSTGGQTDLIKAGETGLLVTAGDEQELAEAIIKLLENEELRANCIANAKELILKEHTPNVYMERLGDIYRELV